MTRVATFLFLSAIAFSNAFAQSFASVDRPELVIGDRWVFRYVDLYNNEELNKWDLKVTGLHDDSARSRTTGVADRLANAIGWMRSAPLRYPTRDWFEQKLADAGLAADFRPLHGRTPFNNWLIVATR